MKPFSLFRLFGHRACFLAALSVFLALPLSGCHSVAAPLPTNAINSIDAQANTLLHTAYAFASTWTAAVQSTDPKTHVKLTVGQIAFLNKLNLSLNIAIPLEQAYHASPTATNGSALGAKLPAVQAAFSDAENSIAATLPAIAAATTAAKLPTNLGK